METLSDSQVSLKWTVPVLQVHSAQAIVFFDGNRVPAPLLHNVRHLPLRAWSTPEVCQ